MATIIKKREELETLNSHGRTIIAFKNRIITSFLNALRGINNLERMISTVTPFQDIFNGHILLLLLLKNIDTHYETMSNNTFRRNVGFLFFLSSVYWDQKKYKSLIGAQVG